MGGVMREHIHHPLNQEVTAIGGHYVFTHEVCLPFNDREVLYLCGYAVYDTTCCGSGGCNYAVVVGFVWNWKNKKNEEGLPVSQVEPIDDPDVQKEISRLIQEKESVSQVNYL